MANESKYPEGSLGWYMARNNLTLDSFADLLNRTAKMQGLTDADKSYSRTAVHRMIEGQQSLKLNDLMIIKTALGLSDAAVLGLNQVTTPTGSAVGAVVGSALQTRLTPMRPIPNDVWKRVDESYKYLETAKVFEKKFPLPEKSKRAKNLRQDFQKVLQAVSCKPKIAFLGRPDAGKTTLLAMLLGTEDNQDGRWLPTAWTPETCQICFLRHINARPAFMGNDRVLILRESSPKYGRTDNIDLVMHNPALKEYYDNKIEGKTDADSLVLDAGGFDLLKKYAAHSDDEDAEKAIGSIIVFADAPILYNCDLIDLPGFSPDGAEASMKGADSSPDTTDDSMNGAFFSRDSQLSFSAIPQADAVVYMSQSNSFCTGEDADMVRQLAVSLPFVEKKDMAQNNILPLGNLFVVASQAGIIGDDAQLSRILDNRSTSIWKRLKDNPLIQNRAAACGYEYTQEVFRSRFFTSEKNSAELTNRLFDELSKLSEQLAFLYCMRFFHDLKAFLENEHQQIKEKLNSYQTMLDKRTAAEKKLEEDRNGNAMALVRSNAEIILREIDSMQARSQIDTQEIYYNVINPDHILSIINREGYTRKQSDLKELNSDLNAELNNKITKMLIEYSRNISGDIESFLNESNSIFTSPNLDSMGFAFNAKRAFFSGIAGATTLGALGMAASACGNLGGYILVAKGVSLLATLGIHVGGTAAAMSAVSAIGGPVTLGIAVATLAALSLFGVLGGTWKATIGSKIVKQYAKADVLGQLKKQVAKYWDDTRETFKKCQKEMENAWEASLQDRADKLADGSTKKLQTAINNYAACCAAIEKVLELLNSYELKGEASANNA